MKKILYKIFYPKIYKRCLRLKIKQKNRVERLKDVVEELGKVESASIRELCRMLWIKPDENARDFLYNICMSKIDIDKEAKRLPL